VPNTHVPPLPGHRQVATLEFEGPPGRVGIKPGATMIGRHTEDDVSIPDVRVSRQHARLLADSDGGFEIANLTAARPEPNPMLVNGRRCEAARIGDGDVITLGGVSFRFRQAAA
jgi:pSer/pThr/pTyr-binding forkhead associated (FHA) protein